MNKRELVEAFFHNEEVDHVPVGLWQHFSAPNDHGKAYVDAQMDYYRKTDLDFVKISMDGYFGFPNPILKDIEHAETLLQIKPLDRNHPWIQEQIQRAADIVHEVKGECMTFYTMYCPLSYLRLEVGWDKMMQLMRENPEAMKHACDVIAEDIQYLAKGILDAGVDGIFYSVQNAEVTRFTYEEYRSWVTPSDRKVLDYINTLSEYNVLHCCGWEPVHNRLEDWKDYPSGAVNWAVYTDDLPIAKAREFFHRPVWGGFDNGSEGILNRGTKEEIQAETRKLIAEGGKRGYMIGPDCSLCPETPIEHIQWVVEQSRQM